MLLGKEQPNAAEANQAKAKQQIRHNDNPLEELTFSDQVRTRHRCGKGNATAHFAGVVPSPDLHENEKSDHQNAVNSKNQITHVLHRHIVEVKS